MAQLLSLLAMTALSFAVAAVVYFAARALETRTPSGASLSFVLSSLGLVSFIYRQGELPGITQFAVLASFVLALSGATFHLKSGAASARLINAFALLFFTTLLTGILLDIVAFRLVMPLTLAALTLLLRELSNQFPLPVIYFFFLTPILWMPFLCWAYRRWGVRPGFDRAFEDGEFVR